MAVGLFTEKTEMCRVVENGAHLRGVWRIKKGGMMQLQTVERPGVVPQSFVRAVLTQCIHQKGDIIALKRPWRPG